jgi:hypothetical protein
MTTTMPIPLSLETFSHLCLDPLGIQHQISNRHLELIIHHYGCIYQINVFFCTDKMEFVKYDCDAYVYYDVLESVEKFLGLKKVAMPVTHHTSVENLNFETDKDIDMFLSSGERCTMSFLIELLSKSQRNLSVFKKYSGLSNLIERLMSDASDVQSVTFGLELELLTGYRCLLIEFNPKGARWARALELIERMDRRNGLPKKM